MAEADLDNLAKRAAAVLGGRLVSWRPVAGGYTTAARYVIACDDGRTAFAKGAVDERTAGWLRTERRIYAEIDATFLPRMLGWDDDGARPVLLLEDLSGAGWEPHWDERRVAGVLDLLAQVGATPAPDWLPAVEDARDDFAGWWRVAIDPAPFLGLGLCDAGWLDDAIGPLVAAETAARLDGSDLLHLDVRSDNLCFDGDRAVLVDWNWACRGNRLVDVAFWLPSLHAEGGPAPDAVLPGEPELAAWISGFFAAQAGLPPGDMPPGVRELQRSLLRTAFPWAVRALGLRAPRA